MTSTDPTAEELRRAVYGPDATAEDRRRYAELLALMPGADGKAGVGADAPSPDHDIDDVDDTAGDDDPLERRRRPVVAVVAALLVGVLALGSVGWAVSLLHPPRPDVVPVPATEHEVLFSYSNLYREGMRDGVKTYWPSGSQVLQSTDPLEVAIRCWGRGRVLVTLAPDESVPFICTDGETVQRRTVQLPDRGLFLLMVETDGDVLWGVSVARITDPAVVTATCAECERL